MVHNSEWDPQWFAREALPMFIHNYSGFVRRGAGTRLSSRVDLFFR